MKKRISIFVIIILIILIVFGLAQINKGKIELTQLSSHSKDRMMGYIVNIGLSTSLLNFIFDFKTTSFSLFITVRYLSSLSKIP